jgi:hypothetical protein
MRAAGGLDQTLSAQGGGSVAQIPGKIGIVSGAARLVVMEGGCFR